MESNPFRKEYRELTGEEVSLIAEVKDTAVELYKAIEKMASLSGAYLSGREQALAKTNLEQAVMWAVKGITG